MRFLNFKTSMIALMACCALAACNSKDDQTGSPSGNGGGNGNGSGNGNGNNNNERTIQNAIESPTTWDNKFSDEDKADYIVETQFLEVKAELTIEPGVKVQMPENAEVHIQGQGVLNASGKSDQPIVFTGKVETNGYWRGIKINSPSDQNNLKHVHLKYGGGSHHGWDGKSLLWLSKDNNASATIQNTTFEASAQYGLHLEQGVQIPGFENNTFKDNKKASLWLYANAIGKLDTGSNYNQNNGDPYVEVVGNEVNDDQTWKNINTHYWLNRESFIQIKADVTVEAGVDFRFSKNRELHVKPEGSFNAVGQPDQQITFKGDLETHGHWRGIKVNSPSSKNKLEHVEIAYAAGRHHGWDGQSALWVASDDNGNLTLKNCEIHHTTDWGLTVNEQNDATIKPDTKSKLLDQNDFHDNGLASSPNCSGDCHIQLN